MYRYQRYIYDLTRRYYLFGRDMILREINESENTRILEMGCGTARNLIQLAHRNPELRLYGIDASEQMLRTARSKIQRAGLQNRIELQQCLAEDVDYQYTFHLDTPFDGVLFSYSLSMIPAWQEALETAIANLRDDGCLYIVDFWDLKDFPGWFQKAVTAWLARFHVRHERAMIEFLHSYQNNGSIRPVESIFGHYAFKTTLRKNVIDGQTVLTTL